MSENQNIDDVLRNCEQILKYQFQDRDLLKRCLTHASVAKTRLDSNERLEFLGDAVLGMIVCEMLFEHFPEEPEGELTRVKSALVSRNTCARISNRLKLEECLLLGKGLRTHEMVPSSIIAAVVESLIAGVYLDGGLDEARKLVRRLVEPELKDFVDKRHSRNFKSLLQQISQKIYGETPLYHLLDEKGPDHSKCFKMAAAIGSRVFPAAWGPNKKEAEQAAASNALSVLDDEELQSEDD
ncbi:MAG: ribonuclease III [Planctomycetaceae bacterium]